MRILFSTTAGMGHFHPLVPLAQAAERAGHTVAFACPASFCERVRQCGFTAFAVLDPDTIGAERGALMGRIMRLPQDGPANDLMLADGFIGLYARHSLPALIALCRRWEPDVVVREEYEFAGALAAELMGVPHAAVQVGFGSAGRYSPTVALRLYELRATWGLAPDPELQLLERELKISFDPPSLLAPGERPAAANTHHLQATVFDRSGAEELPAWLQRRPDRPLVYLTLGTEAPRIPLIYPQMYELLLAGVRDLDATVVLTIGRDRDPADFGRQPEHVHVERYVPQSLLLPDCAAIVTHGGHNTVLAALSYGVPLLVTPLFADQFDNARRCVALGVGQALVAPDLTPAAVGAGVRALLREPRFGAAARRIQAEMRALPEPAQGVALLEQLVGGYAPAALVAP